MQDAGVGGRVQRLLEQYSQNERMLDAYWQWATNPTPPSAGYALEENCGFIATNLLVRYGEPAIELVHQLAEDCTALRAEASIYDIRQAVIGVLNGPTGQMLRDGVVRRLNAAEPVRRALATWLVARARWLRRQGPEAWLAGEFDWSLGIDLEAAAKDLDTPVGRALCGDSCAEADLMREALAVGLVNRLFYRNVLGRMEPKFRPGPRVPLVLVAYADRT